MDVMHSIDTEFPFYPLVYRFVTNTSVNKQSIYDWELEITL